MRQDMSKVLVESPRVGRAWARATEGTRRVRRHRLDPDGEGGPQHVGMRRDAVSLKHFGEHLAPLYRWLARQANRPWTKVWSELCAHLDRRNVVQAHLFEHLRDRVVIHTVWQDGKVYAQTRWSALEPIERCWEHFYVHPRTGLLLVNRGREIAERRRRQERAARAAQPHPDRRSGLPGMAADCQWHRIDGIWYAVTLANLGDRDDAPAYDVVLRCNVDGRQRELLHARYGRPDRYAIAKRQLDGATLRANGLGGTD